MRQFISNPLGITPDTKSEMRLPAVIVGLGLGVLACWIGSFERLGYTYAFFSIVVLLGSVPILVKSAVLSLGISFFLARRNLRLYGEVTLGVFVATTLCYARWVRHY